MQCLATFRLSTSPLHRHCYSSQQDELRAPQVRTWIAWQVRVRTMQAGQTRSCGARAHTLTSTRTQRRLQSAHKQLAQLPYPPAPPPRPPSQHSFGQLKICQPSNPTNLFKQHTVFRSPTDSQGRWP